MAAVILAAGKGTRMRSALPKALHPIAGRAMIHHVLDALAPLSPVVQSVVVGPDMDVLSEAVAPVGTAVQHERLGTADALKAARDDLAGMTKGTVLVLMGDGPFIETETLRAMIAEREKGAAVVVLGFRPKDTAQYGRLVTDDAGRLLAIVEHRDADEATRAIGFCNSAIMAIDAARLFDLVERIGNDNAKGEYYLTDIVAIARAEQLDCVTVEAPEEQFLGIDSRADLANAETRWQERRRLRALEEGATLLDPTTVWFSHDTVIGQDVEIGRNVVFGPGVTIANGVSIRDFCHLEGARVETGSVLGPFARLRPGTEIEAGARVGNFVEVKNAVLGEGAKANHLSYIGDASIGAGANIGAGTITCNYDGYLKHKTVVGKDAFVGSNTALVAPVTIGDGAIVAAGSTVTKNVDADALTIARGDQKSRPGLAKRIRAAKKAEKDRLKKRP